MTLLFPKTAVRARNIPKANEENPFLVLTKVTLLTRFLLFDPMIQSINEHEILISSYLLKRNKSHNWQKKWFVLRRNQLSYYKDSKEYKASKVIPIGDILSFTKIPDNHSHHFIIVTNERIYHLRALDSSDFTKWREQLEMILKINEIEQKQLVESDNFFRPRKISENLVIKDAKSESVDDLNHEIQNLNFSGTDDNFTSGLSDGGGGSGSLGITNHSTQSFHHNQLPPPIPEGEEAELSFTQDQENYYNSLSPESPEHLIDKGYLLRLKKRYNQWKRYYIMLTNKFLYFYKTIKDYESGKAYKKINLDDLIDVVELDPLSKSKVYCMLIITPMKRIRFCASNEEELTKWLVLLKTIVKTRKGKT